MTSDLKKKGIFLVFAAANSPEHGVTGAAIGTETVISMVEDNYQVDWVPLHTNGLGQLGARGIGGRFRSAFRAAWVSLSALARLAWRGLTGPEVSIVYLLPAASSLGILRNAGAIFVTTLCHRRAQIVLHIRNGNYFDKKTPFLDRLTRYVNRKASRIFVLSRLLLPQDMSHTGVRDDQISILPNTIDAALLPRAEDRGRGRHDTPIKILYLSNFIEEKGYLSLLAAAENLADIGQASGFSFTFHGTWLTEEDRRLFTLRAEALNQRGLSVNVGGSLHDRAQIQKVYADHHVFCLPTLYAAEAQPRSILEAMANGCAVVATRYRSIPEQVQDGRTGFLVADQDPGQLARTLARFAEQDPQEMGRNGAALFDTTFSNTSVHKALLQALETTQT